MFVSQIFEECAEILGTTNSEKVFRKISQAVQTLMESGHWSHSTAEVDVCTGWDGCSIVLPRGVDTPLAINVDGSPVYFRNRLFQYHVNKGGMFSAVSWAWDDRGFTATAMEIIQPSQLIAIAEVENDVGKTIRVLGTNDGNIPLRSQLENGTGVDGLLVPINSVNDYPLGVILPPNQTIETRSVAIDPLTRFTTTTPHQLDSGQGFNIASFTGTIPVPLSNGQVLYIGVIDAVTIQLFSDQNNAKNGNFPIKLQSIIDSGTLTIKNSKPSSVVTALEFPASPANEPSLPITTANPVAFPQGQTLPPPLLEKVTYFANLIDPKHLQIFTSFQDAQNNVNPVFTTGSTDPIDIDIRKEILPESKLTFAIQHFYKQGDQVQAYTAGGTLPNPLIANQNYFVNVINEFTITLHESQADAIASTPTNPINPIKIIDAGVGSNFLVKLIASTYRSGEQAQVTAPGLNIPAPKGSGASFQAVVTGSVRSVTVTPGAGYTSTPTVVFDLPPEPPFGSGQVVKQATGIAIRNTSSNVIEQILIQDPGAGYTSAPNVTITGGGNPNPTTNAIATATIQTSFVSYFRKVSGGSGYTQAPQVQITGIGTNATAQAVVNTLNLNLENVTVSGTTATATTTSPHGLTENSKVTISGCFPDTLNGLNGNKDVKTVTQLPPINIQSVVTVGGIATVTTALDHNYSTGQSVTISGTGNSAYDKFWATIIVTGNTTFQVSPGGTPASTGAVGTVTTVDPAGRQFTYTVAAGTANATTFGTVFSGEVTAVNVITSGTGYTTSPVTTFAPSTGVFVEFSSTGVLPAPLVSGVAYRAEAPLDTTNGLFTIKNADFSKVNITGGGNGTFYTVLSRTFGVDFTDRWLGDFSSLSTGDAIYFGTDFILPTTVPSVSSTVPNYLNVITSGVSRIYDTELNASYGNVSDGTPIKILSISSASGGSFVIATVNTGTVNHGFVEGDIVTISGVTTQTGYNKTAEIISVPSTDSFQYEISSVLPTVSNIGSVFKPSGLIQVVSFGVGQTYYGRRYSVSPLPYNNLIKPDSVIYLQEDEIVKVSTSGTLPSPLVAGTDYKVKLFGDSIKLFTMNGVLVPLLNAGVGQLSVDIERTITPVKSTQIYCERSLFETGQSINIRAVEGDSLPFPLVASTTYYVRRVDENNIELYNTAANAKGTGTTGRIAFQTPGDSVESTFFIDAVDESVLVKSISQIEKPLTDGFVLLYAWDYGRSNDMTLIGRYHPSEVNPQYRRLRIGKKCAWVRLAYRMSPPFITSQYDYIPIEHERAIIAAIHACDMEDKDFADQSSRYWGIAFNYLRNQQEYIDGHAMVPPQINAITYGDTTDPVMF